MVIGDCTGWNVCDFLCDFALSRRSHVAYYRLNFDGEGVIRSNQLS